MVAIARDGNEHIAQTQEWAVKAKSGQQVHLLLGGHCKVGNINFAHKHLLDPTRKSMQGLTDDDKATSRAKKRLDAAYRDPKNKKLNPKTEGMTRRDKYGKANAKDQNTTIWLSVLPLDTVLEEIADAIVAHDFTVTKDVPVAFSRPCVYFHNAQGAVGLPASGLTINVVPLGTDGTSFALAHIHNH